MLALIQSISVDANLHKPSQHINSITQVLVINPNWNTLEPQRCLTQYGDSAKQHLTNHHQNKLAHPSTSKW
eukprot:c2416_g1_i1 orf=3-212(-)